MTMPSNDPDLCKMTEARHMMALARARPSDPVVVVGPNSLDTVVALCRDGYEQVACACSADLDIATDCNAVVVIGGPVANHRLNLLAHRARALLGETGSVVAHLADLDQDRLFETALAEAGLEVRSTVFDLSGPVLVNHQVARRTELAKAA